MSTDEKNSIDFWPGYVDAMVNILLNLLFLAGIFTIGLVMFNAQSVLNKVQESLIKKEQKKIEKPIEEENKSVELPKVKPLIIPKIEKVVEKPKEETKIEEVVKEFRFKRKIGTATTSVVDNNSFQKIVYQKIGAKILASYEFALGEQNWTKEITLSQEVINTLQNGSMLVVMTDIDNPRLAKEAYTRIISLRTILMQKYQLAKTPEIRIIEHGLLGDESLLERNVFLVNLPNENK